MKKSILLLLLVLQSFYGISQELNAYKYILLPKQFEFQSQPDQYQLNSFMKFLYEKSGYTVVFVEDQYPEDLKENPCLALTTKVNKTASLFNTKMNIDLLDCANEIVFSTKEASSKEKEYKKAYFAAIRETFTSLADVSYSYNPNLKNAVIEASDVIQDEPLQQQVEVVTTAKEKKALTIEGTFLFEKWGKSKIYKEGTFYVISSGDENFNAGILYPTATPNLYIVKWVNNKQPFLVMLLANGNLNVDSTSGLIEVERVH